MTKHTILFLAANPLGTDRLALDEEARAIQAELERSGHRDRFELVTRWAVQPLDLLRELRRLKPTIVHFSGHGGRGPGSADGRRQRDVVGAADVGEGGEDGDGLFLQGADGRPHLVSTAVLEETFGAAGRSVKVVVLNACYSEVQAIALAAHVEVVVGMAGAIGDAAASAFAVGFYGGLGEGESVAVAFQQGGAAIGLDGTAERAWPLLKMRAAAVEALALIDRPPIGRRRRLTRPRVLGVAVVVCSLIAFAGLRVLGSEDSVPRRGGSRTVNVSLIATLSSESVEPPVGPGAKLEQKPFDPPPRARPAEAASAAVAPVGTLRQARPDCEGVDGSSPMCSYRGILRQMNGNPMRGVRVELMGTDCEVITGKFGTFDFGACDRRQIRRLVNPSIFLYLPRKDPVCGKISLRRPPDVTEVRVDLMDPCGVDADGLLRPDSP